MPLNPNVYAGSRGCTIVGRSVSWISPSHLKTHKGDGSVSDYPTHRAIGRMVGQDHRSRRSAAERPAGKRFDSVWRREHPLWWREMAEQRDNGGVGIKRNPRFLWFWRMVAPPVAAVLLLRSKLELRTSAIFVVGRGADYAGPAVYVNWHQYLPFLCAHHGQYRRWLLMSSCGTGSCPSIARSASHRLNHPARRTCIVSNNP